MSVDVVINAHRENGLLALAIQSATVACEDLRNTLGIDYEITVVLDQGDYATREIASARRRFRLLETTFGDLGLARNFAVQNSSADVIAFLDADDLFSRNWLTSALTLMRSSSEEEIYHPECNVYFGHGETKNSRLVSRHFNSDDPRFPIYSTSLVNPYTALCLATRETLVSNPYEPVSKELGNGFEDWTFNLRTLAKGIRHSVVAGTAHFIRDKPGTRMRSEHASRGAVFLPTNLWANRPH